MSTKITIYIVHTYLLCTHLKNIHYSDTTLARKCKIIALATYFIKAEYVAICIILYQTWKDFFNAFVIDYFDVKILIIKFKINYVSTQNHHASAIAFALALLCSMYRKPSNPYLKLYA